MNEQIKVQDKQVWREVSAPYRKANLWYSLWQITNTIVPLILIWFLMYLSLVHYSYWLTLALTPLATGFQIRTFIIFHDCCHGAFFKSGWANDLTGFVCGVISLTSYYHWRHTHNLHHATSGDLERRSSRKDLSAVSLATYSDTNGNILTLTVKEYRELPVRERVLYRLYRHPLVLFVFIPTLLFLVLNRFSSPRAGRRERRSVLITNLAIAAVSLILILALGLGPFLLVELPIIILTSSLAVWLFYIQHQFEHTYWEQKPVWNHVDAALAGSSYYKLPRLLQWFTGNIGFHHIHHLNPRIPNYYLEKCHRASLLFQRTPVMTLGTGLKSIVANLWDEEERRMVAFREIKNSRVSDTGS